MTPTSSNMKAPTRKFSTEEYGFNVWVEGDTVPPKASTAAVAAMVKVSVVRDKAGQATCEQESRWSGRKHRFARMDTKEKPMPSVCAGAVQNTPHRACA